VVTWTIIRCGLQGCITSRRVLVSCSEAGKGSGRRKRLVSQEQADKNYEAFLASNRKERKKTTKTEK